MDVAGVRAFSFELRRRIWFQEINHSPLFGSRYVCTNQPTCRHSSSSSSSSSTTSPMFSSNSGAGIEMPTEEPNVFSPVCCPRNSSLVFGSSNWLSILGVHAFFRLKKGQNRRF